MADCGHRCCRPSAAAVLAAPDGAGRPAAARRGGGAPTAPSRSRTPGSPSPAVSPPAGSTRGSTGRTTTAMTAPYVYAVDSRDREDRGDDHDEGASASRVTWRRSRSGPTAISTSVTSATTSTAPGTTSGSTASRAGEAAATRPSGATQFDVKYADGPRNAEALMVHPRTGRVYIASKNEDGGGLYEGPEKLTAAGTTSSGGWARCRG